MSITDEQYVSLVTYKADGTPKAVPVWIVSLGHDDDGRPLAGFTTPEDSWKVRRIRRDPRVTLQASDVRGEVDEGAEIITGSAVVVTSGARLDEVRAQVKDKYGLWVTAINALGVVRKLFGKGRENDSAVIITLD